MAVMVKLYRGEKPLIAPPNTWTLVTYEKALANPESMGHATRGLITPRRDGVAQWHRNLRWEAFDLPEGDTRPRQIMSRFIRDPHGVRDDTGADDRVASPGRNWQTVGWAFAADAGEPVGVEVWHDHHEPAALGHAQFAAILH